MSSTGVTSVHPQWRTRRRDQSPRRRPSPVVKATRADLSSYLLLTAEFEPFQEVDVMAKVSGYIRQIKVDIGDRVREGQLLATLEIPEMQDDLTRAAAAIEEATAEMATARDELQRAESAHDMAHLSYIADSGRVEERTRPGAAAGSGRGAFPRSGRRSAGLCRQVAHHGNASSAFACRRPSKAAFKTLYQYAVITAPFTGVVTKRYANTGSLIQAGTASQTQAMPVVRLSENSLLATGTAGARIRGSAHSPGRDGGRPRVGAEAHISRPGRPFRRQGRSIHRTMKTEVDVPNPTLALVPGMYAEVDLTHRAAKRTRSRCRSKRWTALATRARVFAVRAVRHDPDRSGRAWASRHAQRVEITVRRLCRKAITSWSDRARASRKATKCMPKLITLAQRSVPKS